MSELLKSPTTDDTFECLGICKGCGEFRFGVRYRKKHEDVVLWLNEVVQPAMSAAHTKHMAVCVSTKCDLKIPMTDASKGIGMRIEQ